MSDVAENTQYAEIADRMFHCDGRGCPVGHRLDDPGHFPKFGAGGRAYPVVGIVSMNPGTANPTQSKQTRNGLQRAEMHRGYDEGLVDYHADGRRGGGIDLWADVERWCGLPRENVYYTELAKCVTTTDERDNGTRSRALSVCGSRFVAHELAAFLPGLRFIICLGDETFEIVSEQARRHPGLAQLERKGQIMRIHHPADRQRRFPGELWTALERVARVVGTRPA